MRCDNPQYVLRCRPAISMTRVFVPSDLSYQCIGCLEWKENHDRVKVRNNRGNVTVHQMIIDMDRGIYG